MQHIWADVKLPEDKKVYRVEGNKEIGVMALLVFWNPDYDRSPSLKIILELIDKKFPNTPSNRVFIRETVDTVLGVVRQDEVAGAICSRELQILVEFEKSETPSSADPQKTVNPSSPDIKKTE